MKTTRLEILAAGANDDGFATVRCAILGAVDALGKGAPVSLVADRMRMLSCWCSRSGFKVEAEYFWRAKGILFDGTPSLWS